MNSLSWFYAAAAGWGLAAAVALTGGSSRAALRAACALSALGGAAAVAGGVSSLLWGNSHVVSCTHFPLGSLVKYDTHVGCGPNPIEPTVCSVRFTG